MLFFWYFGVGACYYYIGSTTVELTFATKVTIGLGTLEGDTRALYTLLPVCD